MDWLKDKKNMPFVIGGAIVLIVGSLALMLFNLGVFNRSAALPPPPPEPAAVPARPGMGGPAPAAVPRPAGPVPHRPLVAARPHPGAPPGPGGPAALGVAATGAAASNGTAVSLGPPLNVNPAAARDPFGIPINKKGKVFTVASLTATVTKLVTILRPRPRFLLPATDYYSYANDNTQSYSVVPTTPTNGFSPDTNNPAVASTLPRVAGVIFDQGVHAIIQYPAAQGQATGTDQSKSVAPGDTIDGVGRVTSIDSDGITVRTPSGSTISIPVTAGSPEAGAPTGGLGAPGAPPLGFQPGGPPNPNGNF